MHKLSLGKKLFYSVLAIFLAFAAAFIAFQQVREKQYKIAYLNQRLQDYNGRMNEALKYIGNHSEKSVSDYVHTHPIKDLRVTLITDKGKVIFDNVNKNYRKMGNHSNRAEVRQALAKGASTTVERKSKTLQHDYFYSATYFPREHLIIRSALPHNNELSKSLRTNRLYLWFALGILVILTTFLYRFMNRLNSNVDKLRTFAYRAEHNESLDVEDLAAFPDDELGEIAERIIKMYKNLRNTRKEQGILKRQLTQNVAHELKTPVASIQGYLETILDNPKIDAPMKDQFLKRCYAQSQRLTSLLHDISTLNRLDDASTEMFDFETVDISQMIKDIQKETALSLEKRNMTFIDQLPDNVKVQGNRSLLYSIFRNLTDNAISYAGENTTILLESELQGNKWHFTFKDNGVGVAPEHLPRLFERFYRVDKGRSRKMGGTGLGLAIVKNAVLLHDGTIRVRNNPEGGLRFDFSLKI
ncbi:MAG: ATP-binding protein [Prevotella sp.]|jgi:signal transduction histidine kinase|nr:ATP-binding protein [Prevotella sp.]MCI1473972.1 ATP-binding protein [Prevotella sp.]MCI1517896.1 ATP-binding protein [Prevotella sp.]MCI1549385.1 ATP-binding protein [Prevotella sp.]MCI1595860.1 ATP-binding protein [Prevotella sp.]